MKRTALFALMISLLLGGCGAGAEDAETVRRWRENCQTGEITFAADILTQTEENVFRCSGDCMYKNGETTITLTAPDTIAGVRYRSTAVESELAYDGAALLLGEPEGDDFSPARAVPRMMEAMAEGRLARTWREDGFLVAELESEDAVVVTLWLRGNTLHCAQIRAEGYTVAEIQIDQWQQKEA